MRATPRSASSASDGEPGAGENADRPVDPLDERADLRRIDGRNEDAVGAGVEVGATALDSALEACCRGRRPAPMKTSVRALITIGTPASRRRADRRDLGDEALDLEQRLGAVRRRCPRG